MDSVAELAQSVAEMSDETLYDQDFPAWCERQAERLRRLAAVAAGDEQLDWPRIIGEIEDMGAAERRRVEGLLVQAFAHLLKLRVDPNSQSANHRTLETRAFLLAARRAYAASMRQRLDLDDLWGDAIYEVAGERMAVTCPFTLADLMTSAPDVARLVARLPSA